MTLAENQKNNIIEAEILEEIPAVVEPEPGQHLTIDPAKVLRRMMARGFRTSVGKKNLSPKRVEKRRLKNKAARRSRKK